MSASVAPRSLGERDVHVWTAHLALPAARLESLADLLSSDESLRAARFARRVVRDRFIAARGQLRELLSSYIGVPARTIRFDYSKEGKPSLSAGFPRDGVQFNLSHSDDVVVYAISCVGRIGIDVERVKQFSGMQAIAERFFSPAEREEIAATSPDAVPYAFHRCWTRKEAYLKARGLGLAGLDAVDPNVAPDAARWSLMHFAPTTGYIGAVAVETPAAAVSYGDWETLQLT